MECSESSRPCEGSGRTTSADGAKTETERRGHGQKKTRAADRGGCYERRLYSSSEFFSVLGIFSFREKTFLICFIRKLGLIKPPCWPRSPGRTAVTSRGSSSSSITSLNAFCDLVQRRSGKLSTFLSRRLFNILLINLLDTLQITLAISFLIVFLS